MPERAHLRLVSSAQTPCWPWRLRDTSRGDPNGGWCAECGAEIAVLPEQRGFEAVCLYCALGNGVLPLEEVPPDNERSLHQLALDERARRAA